MDIDFLEVLYYTMSIVASSTILYGFLKNIGVSIGYEIIFLNVLQRRICKLYYLIKRTICIIISACMFVVIGGAYKEIYIMIVDSMVYIFSLHFFGFLDFSEFFDLCKSAKSLGFPSFHGLFDIFDFRDVQDLHSFKDFRDLLHQKIIKIIDWLQLKEYISFLKKYLIYVLKVVVCLVAAYFSYILLRKFEYKFIIFQVLILVGSYSQLNSSAIQKFKIFFADDVNKYAYIKLNFPYALNFIAILLLKAFIFYDNNAFSNFTINVRELNAQNMHKWMYNVWISFKNERFYVIVCILFLSILLAYCEMHIRFNIEAYLWYENKSWKILYTTADDCAICAVDNFIIMIKTDIIKTNYYCVAVNGTYRFYEKSEYNKLFHGFN